MMPPDTERTLFIELNLEEGNLLLTALAECPFKTVFELIGKLNQQAHVQFGETGDHALRKPFELTEQELALSVSALGKLPYERVHRLLAHLNRSFVQAARNDESVQCEQSDQSSQNSESGQSGQ